MINVAEHVQRPVDMLMFLGEYFKEIIYQTEKISDNIKKSKKDGANEQANYYITNEIINSLGTACKQYIEAPRQQLRLSIALARNPAF